MSDRVIQVYQIEVDGQPRWKYRVVSNIATVEGFSTFASRDDAIAHAQGNPANHGLRVEDITGTGRS